MNIDFTIFREIDHVSENYSAQCGKSVYFTITIIAQKLKKIFVKTK